MTNVSSTAGASANYVTNPEASAGVTAMSPDALLAYCQMQLGSLDDQMTTQINAQDLALQQRTAVQNVETTLEGYGDTGPKTVGELAKCSAAFDTAIAQLPPGDPVARELATQQAAMNTKYGGASMLSGTLGGDDAGDSAPLGSPPANDDWKGTIDTVDNLNQDIKSGAEIQMLQLQDLVSQRQQAVEQATGMMSKEDQTLEDAAKAIGQ